MKLFLVHKNGRYGYIDKTGEICIAPRFYKVFEFSEGLAWAAIKIDDTYKVGFIDTNGDWAIDPQFEWGWISTLVDIKFNQGLAPVMAHNRKFQFIDTVGNAITEPIYDKVSNFSEDRALVCKDKKYGYIDREGNEIIPCQYDEPNDLVISEGDFYEGLALVSKNGEYGYIDKDGNEIIPIKYMKASRFSEGVAFIGGFFGGSFINTKGETIMKTDHTVFGDFHEGLVVCASDTNGLIGYIDKTGEWKIEPQFRGGGRFSEGIATFKKGGKTGYIDNTGKIIIEAKFENAMPFKNGLAHVIESFDDDIRGYINTKGDYVWLEENEEEEE